MDIKLPHPLLTQFLDTNASPEEISEALSLCGPTIERLTKTNQDYIYDIEVITNRVDSASALGIAREACAILPEFGHKARLQNNPYKNKLLTQNLPNNPPLKVQILDTSLVPRFTMISLTNVTIKESPDYVKKWLHNSGQRPINNIIDITNELTLKYGQPVHVFDLDKIKGQKMILRESKKGEKILTLDNKTHTLQGRDIIITDGDGRLIDLCGIMGGGLSHVDTSTKNILLFVQKYEPNHIRRTSLYTQERTLASQLFEKSTDPEIIPHVLNEGIKLLKDRANAEISSSMLDIYNQPQRPKQIKLDLDWLNRFIGVSIAPAKARQILTRLGFTVFTGKKLTIQIPSWRYEDINIPEDLAEEIARVYGYFKLPSNLPLINLPTNNTDPILNNEYVTKNKIACLGFTEIYNLSLVSKSLFDITSMKLYSSLKLDNPLSNEFEYLRTSLIPQLLETLASNQSKTTQPIQVFELSNIYLPQKNSLLPNEQPTLCLATQGLDYLTAKGYLEALAISWHLELTFKPITKDTPPFTTNETAEIILNNKSIGHIGAIKKSILHQFELKNIIVTELNFSEINKHINPIHTFKPIPNYASTVEDVTISSPKNVGDLMIDLKKAHPFVYSITYLSSYQSKHSFRIELNNPKGNLTQKESTSIKNKILEKIKE